MSTPHWPTYHAILSSYSYANRTIDMNLVKPHIQYLPETTRAVLSSVSRGVSPKQAKAIAVGCAIASSESTAARGPARVSDIVQPRHPDEF